MTDTPWTPGPWVVGSYDQWRGAQHGGNVTCYEVVREDAPPIQGITEADARLIAAGPEMAELLERAVEEHLNQDTLPMDPGCWCWAARDLLARIKGES